MELSVTEQVTTGATSVVEKLKEILKMLESRSLHSQHLFRFFFFGSNLGQLVTRGRQKRNTSSFFTLMPHVLPHVLPYSYLVDGSVLNKHDLMLQVHFQLHQRRTGMDL